MPWAVCAMQRCAEPEDGLGQSLPTTPTRAGSSLNSPGCFGSDKGPAGGCKSPAANAASARNTAVAGEVSGR